MSTLNSSSTEDEIEAALIDNASYEEDRSVSKAKAFLTALRIRIAQAQSNVAEGATAIQYDLNMLYQQSNEVRRWLAENDTSPKLNPTGNVKFISFKNYRE